MKIFKNKIWILTALCLLLVGGVAIAVAQNATGIQKSYSWQYKMIVNIETPDGLKTGSAVRRVDILMKPLGWDQINKKMQYAVDRRVTGEAVMVDLGQRGKVFALIQDTSYADVLNAFNLKENGYEKTAKLPVGSKADYQPEKYPGGPKMVIFADINDPKSVQLVMSWDKKEKCNEQECYAVTNNMEKLFGENVKLKNITLEITNEPVSWGGMDEWLPWLQSVKDGYLHGGFTSKGAPLGLHGGNFKIGEAK